jgi:hypothetical protein
VEPSGFRTGFLTKDSLAYTESKIPGYDAVKNTQQRYLAANGKQPGDPGKAADILIELAGNPAPPLRLLLGADAYKRATGKLADMTKEAEKWKEISIGADFEESE